MSFGPSTLSTKAGPTAPHDLYGTVGDRLRLNFHPGQMRAWDSDKRIVAIFAGTQGGKTSFGSIWLWKEIYGDGKNPGRGGGDYLAVTASYDLFKLKMLPSLRDWFERTLGVARYWSGDRILELADPATGQFLATRVDDPMWGRIILRSADAEGGLESSTAKGAWLDEAGMDKFILQDWEAVRRRLALKTGRALLTTTLYNYGWIISHIYEPWKRGDPEIEVIHFDSTENPSFPREEFERARASMPLWRFNMTYRGIPERPAGLIYDSFDESKHIVPSFAVPTEWPRYLGLDFGGVNTAGVFYAAEPGTRRLYLYREYKAGGRTAREHADALKAGEPMVPQCVGGSKSEGQWRSEFRAAGLPVREPATSDVEVGIGRVYGAHKRDEVLVFSDCTTYLAEKRAYSRKLDHSGNPTETIEDKHSYHLCLAAGTGVTTDRGIIPIEQVEPGMYALTRAGWRRVTRAWTTGIRPVKRATFSDGTSIAGTHDHPIWIYGLGFVSLGSLRYNDTVVHQRENPCWQRHASSLASGTIATPSRGATRIGSISSGKDDTSIAPCGNTTTARYRPITTSTIETKTRGTTRSRTSNSLPVTCTLRLSIRTSPGSGSSSSSDSSARKRADGTVRPRVGSGTDSTSSISGRMSSPSPANASIVVEDMRRFNSAADPDFVRSLAGPRPGGRPASMTFGSPANDAGSNSPAIGISPGGFAPVRVRTVRDAGHEAVFNLTVEGEHEYYANGIVVSNCDAERYILGWLRNPEPPPSMTVGPNVLRGYRGR
jgi:hypothetical protein